MRRLEQPSHMNFGSKEFVDCLMCGVSSDSDDDIARRKLTRNQVNQGIRLDKLMQHYKGKHRDAFPSAGRSLLDLGFTILSAVYATSLVEDVAIPSEAYMGTGDLARLKTVASRTEHPHLRRAVAPHIPIAIAKH
jgi:hypothetical protein